MSHRDDPESTVRRLRFPAAVVVLSCLAISYSVPSSAQRAPNVTIDYGVLESLGPALNVPRMLLPSMPRPRYPLGSVVTRRLPAGRAPAAEQRIVLTPPRRSKARRLPTRSRAARRAIARAKPIVRSRLRKPAKLVPKPASAKKMAGPRMRSRKLAARPPIPRPPIKTTRLGPTAPVPPVAEIRDRPRPPSSARTPVPPPPPAMARKPDASQSAKAPPAGTAASTPAREGFGVGRSYRLAFGPGVSKLDAASIERLDEIAAGSKGDRAIRLKLLAYAGAADQTASQSRRLSLSRALAVRSYLIDKGVRSVQFEVQAKGRKLEGGPPDRVDVIVTKR